MGARRSPATEALLAELLTALRGADPELGMTANDLGAACTTTCRSWEHDPDRRDADPARCWVCKGTGLRPRLGSEVRRYVLMLGKDGLARCQPGARNAPWPDCLQHWFPTPEADVAGYWADLAEQADHHVAP